MILNFYTWGSAEITLLGSGRPRRWVLCAGVHVCEQRSPPAPLSTSAVTSVLGRGGWGWTFFRGGSTHSAAGGRMLPETSGVGPLRVGWRSGE